MSRRGEIEQQVSIPGCEADIVCVFEGMEIDKDKLAEGLAAYVDFRRGVVANTVYLEGSFSAEQLMALFLALSED